jgi:competence protein ComEC
MKTTRPLVYYAAAVYFGCIAFIISKDSKQLGAALTASFLIIILVTLQKRYSFLVILFFIIGFINISLYYSTNSIKKEEVVKITKISSYYCQGSINGKKVYLKGDLKAAAEGDIINAGGSFKPLKDYYKGIAGEFYIEKTYSIKHSFTTYLYTVKGRVYEKLKGNIGEERAALIMSLCFGDTKYVSEEQKYEFQELGVVHAISVSGFHMAVIYKLLEGVFGIWTSRGVSFIYLVFTGSQAATVRAFIMIIVLKLSKKLFRNYDAVSSLCLSAIIILTAAPYYASDLGFMLSYLSTLGIILYYKRLKKRFYKLPISINESLSLTISAQPFSMPYAAMSLGNISFGFLAGNLVLMPLYTVIVVLGNLALVSIAFTPIFKLLCSIISFIMIIVEGAHFILLKLTPPVSYLTFMESIILFIIIASFMLFNMGYNRFKAVPAMCLLFLMLQYYSFFPQIQFLNTSSEKMVLLKYKAERIIIYNNKSNFSQNFHLVDTRYFADKAVSSEKGLTVRLGRNCTIRVLSDYKNSDNINLEVNTCGRTIVITTEKENAVDVDFKKYDIIKLPVLKGSEFKDRYGNKIKSFGYKVIFNKLYPVYGFLY